MTPRRAFVTWLSSLALAAATGCGDSEGAALTGATSSSGADDDAGSDGADDGGPDDDGQSAGSGSDTGGTLGLVLIDAQEAFVSIAANPDMDAIVDRTEAALALAGEHQVPLFITYEASMQGDHALHAPLVPHVPAHAQQFVKTTFAATGLPAFFEAVQASGLSHLAVLGAETDVCVMQTVLGLRDMGVTVLLHREAVFTSESNTSPALRRMEQAGAMLVGASEVAGYAAAPATLPKGGEHAVRIVRPLQMGVVLHELTDAAMANVADPWLTHKKARLRELLLVSEWFDLPVYVNDTGAGLPSDLASFYQGVLRPISQLAEDAGVEQLVFAGTDGSVAASMTAQMASREVFVMEDALLAQGSTAAQREMLAPLFDQGLVPTTYKSFYYEMTQSVDLAEWPSQTWVQKFEEYYWITQAPEDLPPIVPD